MFIVTAGGNWSSVKCTPCFPLCWALTASLERTPPVPGFCLPIGSSDILVSQMMGPRGSSEKMSLSLLLCSPKPSPASARLDSPESPESQGICKMYVNHPVCTSICTSRVITCRISLIPKSKHGDPCAPQPRLGLFPRMAHHAAPGHTCAPLLWTLTKPGEQNEFESLWIPERGSDMVTWEAAPRQIWLLLSPNSLSKAKKSLSWFLPSHAH